MIRCITSFFLLLFVTTHHVFAQDRREPSSEYAKLVLERTNLSLYYPEGFKKEYLTECFEDNQKLAHLLRCVVYGTRSEDEECVSFLFLLMPSTQEHVDGVNRVSPDDPITVDDQHLGNLKGIIRKHYGKEAVSNWKDYVCYYPEEQAKAKFNADTAILVTIELEENFFYKGKYGYLDTLVLTKKGRGTIFSYLFYTDRARKDIARYRKGIEGMFWYED